jgi:tryptophan halogenase
MHIVIVGGGTAGWTAAAYLVNKRPNHKYTVIESSKIPTIGVGEAATGLLTGLVDQLGIDRWEFMHKTDALPKLVIKFENWRGHNEDYLHPIDSSYSSTNEIDYMVYHSIATNTSLSSSSRLATLVEMGFTNISYDYDYQSLYQVGSLSWVIDPAKTAEVLKKFCIKRGIEVVDCEVEGSVIENGKISCLKTTEGEIPGDLFVDCTGSARILADSLGAEWISYDEYLPVNKAIPFRIKNEPEQRNPWILSRALNNGWMWEAPTRNRVGRGYIFSDNFISSDQALEEIRSIYGDDAEPVKEISFNTGVLKQHFVGNVLTLGMGAGFLEPMQATSIHSTLLQLNDFVIMCMGQDIESTCNPLVAEVYNKKCQKIYRDMMEFVAIHYATDRSDTPFWKYVSNELKRPDKVTEMIELAKVRLIRLDDFDNYLGAPGAPLWIYSMAGLGLFDPAVCQRNLEEFGYVMELVREEKHGKFLDLVEIRQNLMSQTDLNLWFLNNPLIGAYNDSMRLGLHAR